MTRRAHGALALAALPALLGFSKCGIWFEFTEGRKYVEPFERVRVDVDRGSALFVAYDRPDATLKRHTSGFEPDLGPVHDGVEDGVLVLDAACAADGGCWYDHMLEFPLGVSVEFTMKLGYVEIGYVDRDLVADIDEGGFKAVQLASPTVELTLGTGDLAVDFAAAPQSVALVTGAGDIDLTVPAGSYRCELSAPAPPTVAGVVCDPAAASVLSAATDDGALTVTGV